MAKDQFASHSRRDVLRMGAAGAAAITGWGLNSAQAYDCAQTPSQTQGPFWVDEGLNRSDIRSDPDTGDVQDGLPLRLTVNVAELQNGECVPASDTWVDIWHCNALGAYSDVTGAGNPDTRGQRWLRGYQVTDSHGNVRFTTIYPGWYPGRTVHIHFRIRQFSGTSVTFNFASQMYFNDDMSDDIFANVAPYNTHTNRTPATNQADNLYNSELMLRMSYNNDHVVASFNAVISSVNRSLGAGLTPTDLDSMSHLKDFGGGGPRLKRA